MRKLAVFLATLTALFIPVAAFAASPTVIGTPVTFQSDTVNPTTYDISTYTQSSTGQNQVLCVIFGANTNNQPTAMAWDQAGTPQSLTKLTQFTAAQALGSSIWCVPAPTAGNKTLRVTEAGNISHRLITIFSMQDTVQNMGTVVDITGQSNVAAAATDSQSVTTTADGDVIITWNGVLGDKTASIAGGASQVALVSGGVYNTMSNLTEFGTTIGQATNGAISTSISWTGNAGEDLFVEALKYQAPASTVVPADTSSFFMLF